MFALTLNGERELLRDCFVPFADIPFIAGGEWVGEVVAHPAIRQGDVWLQVERQLKNLLNHIGLGLLVNVCAFLLIDG